MSLSSNPSVPASLGDDQATYPLSFTLNGKPTEAQVHPLSTLLEVVREDLRYTGTKGACHEGECGSCTVLVDGVPMNSCLILAPQAQGAEIVTVEGLADGETLDRVQEAFLACGAVQCGYCTPGLLISAKAFLEKCPDPTPEEVRKGMEGNICRCTGYMKVVDAVVQAAKSSKGGCHAE
ncbi:(2Fe-2S)-binding protein [bacterium]|nr:(2Fe-2S)-binding protein [bacterium]